MINFVDTLLYFTILINDGETDITTMGDVIRCGTQSITCDFYIEKFLKGKGYE